MTNDVDPDQTAPIGAVYSGSMLFATDDFSRRHFQMHFFLGALRVKYGVYYLIFLLITLTLFLSLIPPGKKIRV